MLHLEKKKLMLGAAFLGVCILGGTIGYTLRDKNFATTTKEPSHSPTASSSYAFTHPITIDDQTETSSLLNGEVRDLKAKLISITDDSIKNEEIDRGSVYYRDLNNGPWLFTGKDYEYKPASLFKVPLMIAYFKEAQKDPKILDEKVTYDTLFTDAAIQNVDSSNVTIEVGKTYTISELIEHMIMYSDNYAAYLLLKHIDENTVQKVFDDLDVPIDGQTKPGGEPFGPRTYASFLRVLYTNAYLNKEYSERALEILSRSTFSHGMRAVLTPGTKASIKFGIAVDPHGKKQLHECGIIYWDKVPPQLLCIMTVGSDYDKMANFIQKVTTAVQDTVTK